MKDKDYWYPSMTVEEDPRATNLGPVTAIILIGANIFGIIWAVSLIINRI